MKIKFAAVALSMGIVALSGCSTSSSVSQSSSPYNQKFYDDSIKVLKIVSSDLGSNKLSFTDDQLKQVNVFVNKYADIPTKSQLYNDYMTTIGQLSQFSNFDYISSLEGDSTSADNTDTTNTDTTGSNPTQPPVMVNGINISIGESMEDVETALGHPYDDNKTIVSGDTNDQLVYRNMMGDLEYYIYCDNGVVTGIQDTN